MSLICLSRGIVEEHSKASPGCESRAHSQIFGSGHARLSGVGVLYLLPPFCMGSTMIPSRAGVGGSVWPKLHGRMSLIHLSRGIVDRGDHSAL